MSLFGKAEPTFTDVRINPMTSRDNPELKAIASVVCAGKIKLTSIRIYDRAGEIGIQVPKKFLEGRQRSYDYFFPVSQDVRKELTAVIAEAYEKMPQQ